MTSLPLKFLLATVLGALIGMERESSYVHDVYADRKERFGYLGGIRTYALIALLGAIAGYVSTTPNTPLFVIITSAFFLLIAIYYAVGGWMSKALGLTTELAAIFAFIIGLLVTSNLISTQLVIAISIIVGLILSIKGKSRSFVLGIDKPELDAFLAFAIVALVILPFLPNKAYHLADIGFINNILAAYNIESDVVTQLEIFNPFRLWFIVALITGIDVIGYMMVKLTGNKKGILLTSAVGGFISSTSTTQSLAQQSNKSTNVNELISAAIFANMTSFIQIFILVAPLNSLWLIQITPVLITIILSSLLAGIYFHKKSLDHKNLISTPKLANTEKKIFSIKPAIRFALLLVFIRILTKTSLLVFGESGFLLSSVIASFSGLDAIVINLSELANATITSQSALITLLAVNATNLLSKAFYAYLQADKKFALGFLYSVIFIIGSSFLGYLFI